MSDYQVLLYYKYTTIDDPETFAKEHLAACKEMELKATEFWWLLRGLMAPFRVQ